MGKTIILLALLGMLANCSGSATEDRKEPPRQSTAQSGSGKTPLQQPADKVKAMESLRHTVLKTVVFTPASPNVDQDIQAEPVWEAPPDSAGAISYSWFVNKKNLAAENGPTLGKINYKKDDWLSCRIIVTLNGQHREFPSQFIRVQGSLPVLELDPIPQVKTPGIFSYKIKARDPNVLTPAESQLKYELLAPVNSEMQFNEKTGEMKWRIDEDTLTRYGQKIEIKFKVSNKCGSLTHSFFLEFSDAKKAGEEPAKTTPTPRE